MTNTRTLTEPLRGANTFQQKHLSALANDLCSQVAKDCWSDKHRDLSLEVIDRLIDRYPDPVPIWVHRAVDQLLLVMEAQG
ncbi:hypothetical protein SynRS9902_02544 [Synechococcus sp. RS9902]|nr:hypothetical protein SynRS9902_02544 [Synechococcus sp. RS9902]